MAEYIRNIIIVGVTSSLVVMVLPKGTENAGRYVRQISAFVLLCVMLSPLSKLSDIVSTVGDELENFQKAFESHEDAGEMNDDSIICSYIVELLCSGYGLNRDKTEVKLQYAEKDGVTVIDEIQIFTSVDEGDDLTAAEKYIGEIFEVETHIFGVETKK